MKKVCSVLMAVLMVLSLIPVSVLASAAETYTEPTIYVESKNAFAGTNVSVNINIANNPGIAGAKLTLTYDSKLTLTNATSGEALSVLDYTKPGVYTTPCSFTWDSESAVADTNGTMLTLDFTISETAEDGEDLPVNITYSTGDFYDINLNDVNFKTVSGVVGIIDYIPGDVNSDNVINGKDVTLLRRYNAGGYGVSINEAAADVNDDNAINGKDITLIRRYNAGGYCVILIPHSARCQHSLEAFEAKAANCTEAGNIAYWHCTLCDKYFSDADARAEITLDETIVVAKGHTVVIDEAVPATETSAGLTEGSHCSVCNAVIVKQEIIPILKPETASITYRLVNNDEYLAAQEINNPNPDIYVIGKGLNLSNDISVPGYTFVGWFDSFAENATRIKSITSSESDDITLYAHWKLMSYTITFDSPLVACESITYKVNSGVSLINPSLAGYNFIGWCDENDQLVTSIPKGTTGNITLYANWTSKRNQTRPVSKLGTPLIFEDTDSGQILFAYEIGTVENVPLSQISDMYQSTAGMKQTFTTSEQTSVSKENAETVAYSISNATTSSSAWSLSSDWNDVVSVNSTYATEKGWEEDEIDSKVTTSSDTYCLNSSTGGATSTVTTSGLSGSLSSNTSKSISSSSSHTHEEAAEYEVSDSASMKASVGAEYMGIKANMEASMNVSESSKDTSKDSDTVSLSASSTGSVGKSVTGNSSTSTTGSSSWNTSSGYTSSNTTSASSTISKSISSAINESKGYGSSYAKGGSQNDSQSFANSETESNQYSSSVTYNSATTTTNTKTIELGGENEGYYRFVLAGTAHVYAVVGYDITNSSYYTFTYSVIDDNTYTFIDYSKNTPNFDDCENGVLPFEVPYFVKEYVDYRVLKTEGLEINTQTGVIAEYNGTDTIVFIPSYMSVDDMDGNGNKGFVVVKGIDENAFKNRTDIVGVSLSNFIKEIPANAFLGCSALTEIVCPGVTTIGSSAFSGCTALGDFDIPLSVTAVGDNAFENVENVIFTASNKSISEQVVNCGAKQIVLNISNIADDITGANYVIPETTEYFELMGGNKTLTNVYLESYAQKTYLNGIKDNCNSGVPLKIASKEIGFNGVQISNDGFGMVLTNENAIVTLRQVNTISSSIGKAILCKNLTLEPATTEITCKLNVSGDIYTYGQVTGTEKLNITNGSINYIDEVTYEKYNKGTFNISFDANDGTVTETNKSAYCYSPVGTLPTPTRQYYTFDGWYTEEDGGELITANTIFDDVKDITLYAHWTLNSFVVTFDANAGSVSSTTLRAYCGKTLGTLPTPTRTGFAFNGWYTAAIGGDPVTESSTYTTANDFTVYAHWTCNSYTASWSTGTGYSITVNRTGSPNGGAATGTISSGSKVYYGDILSISYSTSTGYSLESKGKTSITVTGNVTSSDIYASASLNSYTYNIVYKSSNGTSLGSSSATYKYGTINTISAPSKSGYSTPERQTVKWDSTSAKTITFTYVPIGTSYATSSGTYCDPPVMTYYAELQYQNRTKNSVQVRVSWKSNLEASGYNSYGQNLRATINGVNYYAQATSYGDWKAYTGSARSASADTQWVTVDLNTTNQTNISVPIYIYQTNSVGTVKADYPEFTMTVTVPAY